MNAVKLLKIKDSILLKSRIHNDKTETQNDTKGKKEMFRVRLSNPSVDINNIRLRKRDDSPESPKRLLDLISAYRKL